MLDAKGDSKPATSSYEKDEPAKPEEEEEINIEDIPF
jgi:hypothetical protein